MQNWTIYIIQNKLGQLYTGICVDLKRRFAEHQADGKLCAKALRGKGPLLLKFAAELPDHSSALKAELWIKRQSRQRKIGLINGHDALEHSHQLISMEVITQLNNPTLD